MSPSAEKIQELFLRIVALPLEQRESALDRECGNHPEILQRVSDLLAAHDESDSFLDGANESIEATVDFEPMPPDRTVTMAPLSEVVSNMVIAERYTLREKIGEGGMGEVWVARQSEPIKRRVALKLIKTGMDSRSVLARFEQERQALALMEHPHIARVLDGGMTPTGQPFFVMELVNGLPLDKFCDESRLSLNERLELFVLICQAVQHAHQKGVVHRDLKPANVLVTMIDGRPIPKVIDFGVAKAFGARLSDETMTQFGAVVGTLEYMSPEQAAFSGEDIDTRADIYSLGVILYELLTGLRPIDRDRLQQAALTEMIRIIREDEPFNPSTRLSTDKSLPSLAALRQTEPKKLMALLRGELDWVVMKCLEKDRERRYETANGLVRDIQRYLANEPVEARPPSTGYRLRKLVLKHRGLVAAASVILLALIAAGIGAGYGLVEAGKRRAATLFGQVAVTARNEAEQARAQAEESAERLARIEYGRAMQVAHTTWRNHAVPLTLDMINDTREDLRGWEWNHVRRLCNTELLTIPSKASWVSFSSDGARLVLGAADGMVHIMHVHSYAKQLEWKGHDGLINRALFSSDGSRVSTCCHRDKTAKVWDAASGELLLTVEPGEGVASVAWSPDGTRIAVASGDQGIVYDASTGNKLLTLHDGSDVQSVEFSRDGSKLLTSSSGDKVARLWDSATGEQLQLFQGHGGYVMSAVFNQDGSRVATCSWDQTARIWDSVTGTELHVLRGHSERLRTVEFSPDGLRLLTSSWDKTVRMWDAKTGTQLRVFSGHLDMVSSSSFNPDGSRVVTCSRDLTMKIWDADAHPEHRRLREGRKDSVMFAAYSHDGSRLALALRNSHQVELWDPETETELRMLEGHSGCVRTAAFHPNDAAQLLTASTDKTACLWDTRTGEQVRVLEGHTDEVWTAWFSWDGSRIVTASDDRSAKVWDAGTGAELLTINAGTPLTTASFSPDGAWIVAAGRKSNTAMIYDAATGEEVGRLEGHTGNLWSASFRRDGLQIVTASGDGTARLWDAKTRQQQSVLKGHSDMLLFAAFSPDGSRLLTTSRDGSVKVWDPGSGADLLTLRGHKTWVWSALFSPDGSRIVSCGQDSIARIWDGRPISRRTLSDVMDKRIHATNLLAQ